LTFAESLRRRKKGKSIERDRFPFQIAKVEKSNKELDAYQQFTPFHGFERFPRMDSPTAPGIEPRKRGPMPPV
jgi:hypothetical protein